MSLLQSILHFVEGNHTPQKVTLNTGPAHPQPTSYPQPTDEQMSIYNAKMAADGANMFQAAHPGQTYQPGQNGETYPGGIDTQAYMGYLNAPQTIRMSNAMRPSGFRTSAYNGMQPQYGQSSNFSTPIQGTQNPGDIPLQVSSFGSIQPPQSPVVSPVQGSNFRIQ